MIQSAVKIRAFRWAPLCLFCNSCMKTLEALSLVHICIHPVNIRSPCASLSFAFHCQLIHYQPFSPGYVLHSPSIPQLHPSLSLPAANPLVFSQFSSFLFYLSPFLWSLFENSYHFKGSTEDPRPLSSPLRVVLHWHSWVEHSALSKIVLQTYAVMNRKMYVSWLLKSFK